jgi:murein DD-endopeptidase MepM/ murein hydrolase activator NlpD
MKLMQHIGLIALAGLATGTLTAQAATMEVGPAAPQPGDVLTVTIYPASGEKITGIGMAAFDTGRVKFFQKRDGSVRAFVGFPFDRTGGKYTLRARVRIERQERTAEQLVSTTMSAKNRNYPTQRISMRASTASKMSEKDALRREKLLVQSRMKNSYGAPLWSGSWVIPTKGASSSAYGRKRYVNGRWWGQHNGADIKAPSGAKVVASNAGRVVLSQNLPTLRGNCIVIDHGCNVFTVYMHLSKRVVKEGDEVEKGQLIGRVGATGFVTGPHLHWELRIGWEPCDPFKIARSGLQF